MLPSRVHFGNAWLTPSWYPTPYSIVLLQCWVAILEDFLYHLTQIPSQIFLQGNKVVILNNSGAHWVGSYGASGHAESGQGYCLGSFLPHALESPNLKHWFVGVSSRRGEIMHDQAPAPKDSPAPSACWSHCLLVAILSLLFNAKRVSMIHADTSRFTVYEKSLFIGI